MAALRERPSEFLRRPKPKLLIEIGLKWHVDQGMGPLRFRDSESQRRSVFIRSGSTRSHC